MSGPSWSSPTKSDDDLYDYDYQDPLPSKIGAVPGTSSGFGQPGAGGRLVTGQQPGRLATGQQGRMMTGQRLGTSVGAAGGDLRPMTSVSGAGYQSAKAGAAKSFDPLNQRGAAPALAEKSDNSPEDLAQVTCPLPLQLSHWC